MFFSFVYSYRILIYSYSIPILPSSSFPSPQSRRIREDKTTLGPHNALCTATYKVHANNFHIVGTVGNNRARDSRTNEIVALKKVRMDEEKDGLLVSGFREILILKSCKHANIANLLDVVVGKSLER
uniref:Protein kinase domain-containing protein n=1 Tax=Glossina palpalis gambiensis TaxID=67801 RepID=A0A1B0BYR2_9MUSC